MTNRLEQLDQGFRAAAPFIWCLFWSLLEQIPLGLPGLSSVMPNLLLASAFFWSVNRPDLLPFIALFILGTVHDLWVGGPLGLTPLALILMRVFVLSQQRILAQRLFVISWWGFVIVAILFEALNWTLSSLQSDRLLDPTVLAFQAFLTIAVYPVVARLMASFQRRMLDRIL